MQKTLIYIDINTRAQIDGVGEFITRSGDYLNIERGQWQILCVQFYNRTIDENGAILLEPAVFASDSTFDTASLGTHPRMITVGECGFLWNGLEYRFVVLSRVRSAAISLHRPAQYTPHRL